MAKRTNSEDGTVVRVSSATTLMLNELLQKANSKEFGRRIKPDSILGLGLSLIREKDLEPLREASLTNADKLEAQFRAAASLDAELTKDRFLGMLLERSFDARRKLRHKRTSDNPEV